MARPPPSSRSTIENTGSMNDWRSSPPDDGAGDAGLVVLYAEGHRDLPAVVKLDRNVMLIGREAESANVVIPQRAVSRVHASLTRSAGGWHVRDLGSRNGVIVNGRRTQEGALQHGDELRIGDAVFKLVEQHASAYASYRIDGTVADGAPKVRLPGAVGGLAMARISGEVEKLAPTNLPVLVLGETGTGKELVAQALHSMSGRTGPSRALNCASIPATLVESELFGHVRGAFSGATRDHLGALRAADGGTLLLDEIGDMPLEAQAKLLRVLETRQVVPVGAVHSHEVDVRVVGATHRDLRELVAAGRFRGDLFARLNGFAIHLPPLRTRKEDVAMLVRHALAVNGAADRAVTFGFMLGFLHHHWPYNVRELAAGVKRALILADDAPLDAAHLPEPILEVMSSYATRAVSTAVSIPPPTDEVAARVRRPSRERILTLLEEHGGNVSAIARALGKDRALVNRWIRADGIDPESYRRA